MLQITFSTTSYFCRERTCRLSPPMPAMARMPGWLKPVLETARDPFLENLGGGFLEAHGMGYVIPAPIDFRIDKEENSEDPDMPIYPQRLAKDIPKDQYEGWAPFPTIHGSRQFPGAPWEKEGALKLRGFWYFETPPGYSCLFIPPPSRSVTDLPLVALPGIVETDRYRNLINFPMVPQREFPFVVREGTPLIQVIPFKRADWVAEIGMIDEQEDDG